MTFICVVGLFYIFVIILTEIELFVAFSKVHFFSKQSTCQVLYMAAF
jgi:hypothetical protein